MRRMVLVALALVALVAGCGPAAPAPSGTTPAQTRAPAQAGWVAIDPDHRPAQLYVPATVEVGIPLVVELHGYGGESASIKRYLDLGPEADRRGFLYIAPDGTTDARGDRFWNATDACCDLLGAGVDDSAYLTDLIEAVKADYPVGPVVVLGHSNGAFMAHRLACEHADLITAIVADAGVDWLDPTRCAPSRPVSVLQVHGTADATIAYTGGAILGHAFPGAEETVSHWVARDGCASDPTVTPATLDLDGAVAGPETTVVTYAGCADGSRVQLWRLDGSGHQPEFTAAFIPAALDFLLATA